MKLPVVITLSFQTVLLLGDGFLAAETGKDSSLKVPEKRTNNFRVPMEMPYDTNFWPARGRRSRRDPKISDDDDDDDDDCAAFVGMQCQARPGKPIDLEPLPPIYVGEVAPGEEEDDGVGTCYGNEPAPGWRGRSGLKVPDVAPKGSPISPKRLSELRHKKQKHVGLPQLVLDGNGVYWEPGDQFGEKKKKEDIFWVAKGKKNYDFGYQQN